VRYAHLLSGEVSFDATDAAPGRTRTDAKRLDTLEEGMEALRAEMEELRSRLEQFRKQFEYTTVLDVVPRRRAAVTPIR